MPSETEAVYELWEGTPPVFSSHSRLYHLEPIGVRSSMVESLTSYVIRLAEAHSVFPLTLISKEVLPLWNFPSVYQNGHLVYNHLTAFWKETASLNGMASATYDFTQALKQLTWSHNLHLLTMYPFREILSSRNLLRRTRAWCPWCYQSWQASGNIMYEPLLWSLQCVKICPQHTCLLQSCCPNPDCHRVQYPLTSHSQLGYCSWCGRWLGQLPLLEISSLPLEDKEWIWMDWVGHRVGELLAASDCPLPRVTIMQALTMYLDDGKGRQCSKSALARRLDVTVQALCGWLSGKQIPQLGTLMQICAYLEVSPVGFLTQENVDVSTVYTKTEKQVQPIIKKTKHGFRKMDITGLQGALEEILQGTEDPPPCLKEVAQRLDYDAAHLWKVFPGLCKTISARYLNYHAKRRETRLHTLVEEVRQVIYTLHAQGYYPSAGLVAKTMRSKGVFRDPLVHTTWQETLLELGLRQ